MPTKQTNLNSHDWEYSDYHDWEYSDYHDWEYSDYMDIYKCKNCGVTLTTEYILANEGIGEFALDCLNRISGECKNG